MNSGFRTPKSEPFQPQWLAGPPPRCGRPHQKTVFDPIKQRPHLLGLLSLPNARRRAAQQALVDATQRRVLVPENRPTVGRACRRDSAGPRASGWVLRPFGAPRAHCAPVQSGHKLALACPSSLHCSTASLRELGGAPLASTR
ncbi:hypothetical protein T484DRAFT_2635419 [Baffinella frigidus]|nr:hypothetical protein T484DRAFT_2635419 [Cryptophyta sp. CCMP2293]